MIGLDTNVLVRFFTRDDPEQSPRALALIEAAEERGESLFVSLPALVELSRVLASRTYGYTREQIAAALAFLLTMPVFVINEREAVHRALADLKQASAGSFADHLIGRLGQEAGCRETRTFDRGIQEHALFARL